jgi:prepilin-type N-terminal cleavage/methylation domain-containing protein
VKKGFTLTEVLVVIVILAVLASFLFPIFGSAKSSAQRTGCTSNLHQLYVAMQLYREDIGSYPPLRNPNALNGLYLGGVKLHCPAQHNPYHLADYFLNGNSPGIFKKGAEATRFTQEWNQCREIRQSEFPLVWDQNHTDPHVAYEAGSGFFLFAREGGQIQRVPEEVWTALLTKQAQPVCPLELGYNNL